MKYSVDKYDLEGLYDLEFSKQDVDRLSTLYDKGIVRYRVKTIKSGDVLESEIYPIWNTRGNAARAKKSKESKDKQKRLNHRNAVKNITRLINTNFTDKDVWGTVTYSDKHLPLTEFDANKEMQRFIRRLRIYAERHGYPQLKYVYVTEFGDDDKGKHRVHHHIVTNFPDRDALEQLWRNGARKQTRRLQADEYGYTGLATYITKDPKFKKRFVTSRNLEKPTITIADYKFTKRKANKIVMGELDARDVFENMYKDYKFKDFKFSISDYVSGAYIYARMIRRN